MKKIIALVLMCISACICTGAYAASGVTDEFEYQYEIAPNKVFLIDTLPTLELTTYFPQMPNDNYQLRMYVDDLLTEAVKLNTVSGKIITQTYEFPVYEDGNHTIRFEFVKLGSEEVIHSDEKTFQYINSVSMGFRKRGFAVHFGHHTYFADDTELMKAIGADIFRDGSYWKNIEMSKGNYTFSTYDIVFETAFKSGQDMLFVLSGTNDLYLNKSITKEMVQEKYPTLSGESLDKKLLDEQAKIRTPEQIEAFANYALATAKHYPHVTKFEIVNEPGFLYTGEEYSAIALATAKKLKEFNPEIEIHVGALIDNDNGVETRLEFVQNFLTDELYPYVDVVSYHIYTPNKHAENTKFTTQTQSYFDEIKTEGGWKGLTLTESGWAPGSVHNVPLEKQASELVKRLVIADSIGLELVTLYEFKNSPVDGGTSQYENNLGILTKQYELRLAYYSIKEYMKNTGNAEFVGEVYLADGIRAFAYTGDNGSFIVAWAQNTALENVISKTETVEAEYTFAEDVVITDMNGFATGTGNTLDADYMPKYIYGLSDKTIMEFVMAAGVDKSVEELSEKLSNLGYSDKAEIINSLYITAMSELTADAVNAYIAYCYETGNELIAAFNNGAVALQTKEFSYVLSLLDDAAKAGARIASVAQGYDNAELNEEFVLEFEQFGGVLEFSDRPQVRYLAEPYEEAKSTIKSVDEYNDINKIIPITGEFYAIDEDGVLTVSGKTNKKYASFKVSKDGEMQYTDTVYCRDTKSYSFKCKLKEFGVYTIELYDGTSRIETVDYSDNGYVSLKDKMGCVGYLRAEGLLKWSKLLTADYLENTKGYILPNNISKRAVDEKTYLVADYSDTEYDVYITLSDENGLKSIFGKNENGECLVDITDMADYEIKAFVWDDMTPKSKVVGY